MLVLVVGATGVVGKPLIPKLVSAGHQVIAASRRLPGDLPADVDVRRLDLLDRTAVMSLVAQTQPQAVIHQATALTGLGNKLRRFDRYFATTNRLRTEGLRHLVAAGARLASPRRLIVQSFCGWPWAPVGGPVKSETDPLDPAPAAAFRATAAAIVELENLVQDQPDAVALRYGALYGPRRLQHRGRSPRLCR